MPALPPVPKVLQLAFGTLDATNNYLDINRLHFAYTGTAPSSAQLVSFATTVLTAFGSALAPSMISDLTISSLVAADLSSPTSAVASVSASVVGTLTGGPLPAGTALLMSATVARRYRGGHPRSYLPLGDDSKITNSTRWLGAFVTAVNTAWAGFITAVEGAGWTGAGTISPVNVSYYEGFTNLTTPNMRNYNVPKLRVGGPVIDPIVGYIGRARIATIRKRIGH